MNEIFSMLNIPLKYPKKTHLEAKNKNQQTNNYGYESKWMSNAIQPMNYQYFKCYENI